MLLLPATQRPIRGDKRQLQRVLGRLAASEHVHAEREHAAGVSIVDRLESSIVAGTHPGHEVVVGLAHDRPAVHRLAEANDCRARPHTHSVRHMTARVQPRARPALAAARTTAPEACRFRAPSVENGRSARNAQRTSHQRSHQARSAKRHPVGRRSPGRPRQRRARRPGGRSDGVPGGIRTPWDAVPPKTVTQRLRRAKPSDFAQTSPTYPGPHIHQRETEPKGWSNYRRRDGILMISPLPAPRAQRRGLRLEVRRPQAHRCQYRVSRLRVFRGPQLRP